MTIDYFHSSATTLLTPFTIFAIGFDKLGLHSGSATSTALHPCFPRIHTYIPIMRGLKRSRGDEDLVLEIKVGGLP